jgi:hypothetical protein
MMNVREAHEALRILVENGNGDLELYTEFETVERFIVKFADAFRDGCLCDLEDNEPYIHVHTEH